MATQTADEILAGLAEPLERLWKAKKEERAKLVEAREEVDREIHRVEPMLRRLKPELFPERPAPKKGGSRVGTNTNGSGTSTGLGVSEERLAAAIRWAKAHQESNDHFTATDMQLGLDLGNSQGHSIVNAMRTLNLARVVGRGGKVGSQKLYRLTDQVDEWLETHGA